MKLFFYIYRWPEHLTQPQIKENEFAKIILEIPVQTDVTIRHNRPDIIYIYKAKNNAHLTHYYNTGREEIEKLSKYH